MTKRKIREIFIGSNNQGKLKEIKNLLPKNIKIFYGEYIVSKEKKYDLNKNYIAFCGIGNPESFLSTLKKNVKLIKNSI